MQMRSLADNVIALDPDNRARSARRLAPDTSTVLNDCRDHALTRICEVVSKAFDRIEDELFDLAQASADHELQGLYLDARAQAREKRAGIEAAFRNKFVGEFDGKVRGDAAAVAPKLSYELKLVDESELEESIAMTAMANKIKSGSEEELLALSQRLGFLLHDPDMAAEANPMSPETVCHALQEACNQITSGYRVKLTILRLFEQHVARDLVQVYRDVNSRLVEQHSVLPEIRTTYRAPVQPTSRVPAAPTASVQSGAPAAAAPGAESGDVFAMLQQLMGNNAAAARGRGQGGASAGFAAAPGVVAPMAMEQLLGNLTHFQHEQAPAPTGVLSASDSLDLAAALNVLREISARGLANGASQVDSMTIDIVAMLFDYVFNDREIPAPIKALLAKLQIPILKAALLDKRFFSQKSHPARTLIDRLADLALQCDEDVAEDDIAYRFIDALVNRVQSGFDTDLTMFADEVARLESFINARELSGSAFIEQSARLIHDREQREISRLVAENAVAERLAGKSLPQAVVVMLKARWVDVLKEAHLASGEDSAPWVSACRTVDDLLWSVEPKSGVEDRKRLVLLLPRLLRALQEGFAAIEIGPPERERFFSALVDYHAVAVKAGLRQSDQLGGIASGLELVDAASVEVPAPALNAEPDPSQAGLMRIHLEAGGVSVEEMQLPASTLRFAKPPEPMAQKLRRGTWVEFKRGVAGPVRAKLSWISPHKGVMLFTNPESARAISISPEVFALQLRDGLVRIFADVPLSARAVDSVLHELRAA